MTWKKCTKKEICAERLPPHKYRFIKSDPEFLNNWVQKMDILCQPQSEIGLLGACFFVGVILSIMWMPKYSDKHGRYPIILTTLGFQLTAQIGFILTTNLRFACFLMMVVGMSHPGKNIVCLNYIMEITPGAFT